MAAGEINMKIFDVTQLESFAQSKQEYYLKYILGKPAGQFNPQNNRLSPNVHGDIVHKMIEFGRSHENLLNNVCLELEVVPSDIEKEEILKKFENYLKSPHSRVNNAQHEVPFMLKIDGHFIKGKLDMLLIHEDSWEIVDFKTGENDDKNKYDFQVRIYGLAVAEATGINRGKTTLLFLTPDTATARSQDIDEAIIEKTRNEIKDIICKVQMI